MASFITSIFFLGVAPVSKKVSLSSTWSFSFSPNFVVGTSAKYIAARKKKTPDYTPQPSFPPLPSSSLSRVLPHNTHTHTQEICLAHIHFHTNHISSTISAQQATQSQPQNTPEPRVVIHHCLLLGIPPSPLPSLPSCTHVSFSISFCLSLDSAINKQ